MHRLRIGCVAVAVLTVWCLAGCPNFEWPGPQDPDPPPEPPTPSDCDELGQRQEQLQVEAEQARLAGHDERYQELRCDAWDSLFGLWENGCWDDQAVRDLMTSWGMESGEDFGAIMVAFQKRECDPYCVELHRQRDDLAAEAREQYNSAPQEEQDAMDCALARLDLEIYESGCGGSADEEFIQDQIDFAREVIRHDCKEDPPPPSDGPDLRVTALTHTPEAPSTADQITFKATVANAGTANAGSSTLEFKIGGESNPADFSIPSLEPGDEYTVTREATLRAQNYRITATADVGDDVAEADESNNQRIDEFVVVEVSTGGCASRIAACEQLFDDWLTALDNGEISHAQALFCEVAQCRLDLHEDGCKDLGAELSQIQEWVFNCMTPDLTVMTQVVEENCVGSPSVFSATVTNRGQGASGACTLEFKIGGESHPALYTIPALGPGESFVQERTETLGVVQDYQNTVRVDVYDEIAETDESNNTSSVTYSSHGDIVWVECDVSGSRLEAAFSIKACNRVVYDAYYANSDGSIARYVTQNGVVESRSSRAVGHIVQSRTDGEPSQFCIRINGGPPCCTDGGRVDCGD